MHRLVHGNVIPMGIPWETSHGIGWDRHKLLWDGNGTDKFVPWTSLGLSMGMSFLWESMGNVPWDVTGINCYGMGMGQINMCHGRPWKCSLAAAGRFSSNSTVNSAVNVHMQVSVYRSFVNAEGRGNYSVVTG